MRNPLGDRPLQPLRITGAWRSLCVVGIVLLSIALHVYYGSHTAGTSATAGSGDELWYTQSGYQYADDLRHGQYRAVLDDTLVAEHPALTRVIYAGAILTDWALAGYRPLSWNEQLHTYPAHPITLSPTFQRYHRDARIASSLFGVLLVLLVASFSLPAGFFLAVSTIAVDFTTASFLEAPGMFFATAAILWYQSAKDRRYAQEVMPYLGILVGLATAAKYYYAVAGLVILLDWLIPTAEPIVRRIGLAAVGILAAIATFAIADFPFWTVGVRRTLLLLRTHGMIYGSNWNVVSHSYHTHWYSQLSIIAKGLQSWFPANQQPFLFSIDGLIAVLAVAGFIMAGRGRSALVLWTAACVAFLCLYPVKYVMYTSLAIVPLCLCAAVGAEWAVATLWTIARSRAVRPAHLRSTGSLLAR